MTLSNFARNKRQFFRTAGDLVLTIAYVNRSEDAILSDGSVSMEDVAGLCWDSNIGEAKQCISVDDASNSLKLDDFDSVAMKHAVHG